MLRRASTLIILLALIVGVTALASLASPATQRIVTDTLIKLVVVVGAYIFIGNSGVLSFGHIAFMAIGAYVGAWLTIPPDTKSYLLPGLPAFLAQAEVSPTLAALAAGGVAAAFAGLVGLALMRLSGIAASIGSFAVLAIVQAVFLNWDEVTGGASSLYGMPGYTTMYVALGWSVLAVIAAFLYQESAGGFRLRASREDEVAAATAGVDVHRERLIAFVLSAVFVGIGGMLHGHFLGVVVASGYFLGLTFLVIAMLVIGGINSLSGAVLGVLAVSALAELLRRVESGVDLGIVALPARPGLREVVLAAAMLLVLLFRPQGLTRGRELIWPARRRRSGATATGGAPGMGIEGAFRE